MVIKNLFTHTLPCIYQTRYNIDCSKHSFSEHENKIESVKWILYQSTLNHMHAKISCFKEYKSLVGYKTKFPKGVDDL